MVGLLGGPAHLPRSPVITDMTGSSQGCRSPGKERGTLRIVCRGAPCLRLRSGDGEFAFLLPEILKVPCDGQFVLLLLGLRVLTVVATPLLGRGCGSLDSALGLSARCSCAPLEPAASLYTRCGPEVD